MSDERQDGLSASGEDFLGLASSEEAGGIDVRVDEGPVDDADADALELPEVVPVLPLKNTVLFPFLLSPLLVNTPRSQELIDEVLLQRDRLMVCTAVRHETEGSPGSDDVYRVGTLLRLQETLDALPR